MATATAKKTILKWPKAIGACADLLYNMRANRLLEKKKVDDLETQEKALKEHIIQVLPKSESSGVAGAVARVQVLSAEEPQVKDWDAFTKHILKTKDLALLTKAINKSYINELYEQGKLPPGIEMFPIIKVSCTKV